MKQTTKRIVWLVAFLVMNTIGLCTEPFAKGPYLGQTPPGSTAQIFAPGLICDTRPHRWESYMSFSTDGNTFCYYALGYVYITENTGQGWTTPQRIESMPRFPMVCCLSPDANSIYFIRRRVPRSKRWSLRRCTRMSQGWSLPEELGPLFSSAVGGFSVAADNSICFYSRQGGFWIAPFVSSTWTQPTKIPVEMGNLRGHFPGIAPDKSFLVFYSVKPGTPRGTETDLYLTLRGADGSWTKPRNMGPGVNTGYYEFGARISADKKYMFFVRSNGWLGNPSTDTADIYWVELKEYLPESYR